MTKPSADFARTMRGIAMDQILIPTIHAALYSPDFKGFTIYVPGWQEDTRTYDGKFHPSTQSTWTVRQLYIYLVAPQLLQQERMPLNGILAVTQGKFWHKFTQHVLLDQGTMVPTGHPDGEVKIDDPETNVFGHADGKLTTGECLEIKTINGFQIDKINSEEILREKKFDYWCQTQDYLMVLGLKVMRYFLLNPQYPFPMNEFLVSANPAHQAKRRAEYKLAIELALKYPDVAELESTQTTVPVCCAPGSAESKRCPARLACPIGRMAA